MASNPPDAPSAEPKRRFGDRGRIILIVVAVAVVLLLLSARFFASFYVDYLWHTSVGRGDVFWGVLIAKITLFAMFAAVFIAIAVVNLIIADRLAPAAFSANMHPVVERFHEIFGRRLRLVRFAFAVVVGLLFALPAVGHWQDWLLFQNSKSFGIDDPMFHNDIGFYIFQMPFIVFVLDWLYASIIVVIILTLVTHVLNGGVVIQPPRPKVRKATKAHMAVLLALLAIVKAAGYWVDRYELTTEKRGFVQGATYTVVNAQLPATMLLVLVALFVAGLFLWTLRSDSWRVPVVGSALWVVVALLGSVIYPAAVQALVVNPNQKDREATYIQRNIEATRQGLGIADVKEQPIELASLTAGALNDDVTPLQNARLLNPTVMVPRFRTDQGQRAGLTINDLDVDRYPISGQETQVLMAARELDLNTIPNKSWQGKHLISTHGCGLIQASASQITASGRPNYTEVPLTRPELYFSQNLPGYAVVNTSVKEDVCPGQTDPGAYSAKGGVALDSVFKRLAFALDYLDYNLIGSSAITDQSRLLDVRSIHDRVTKVAPFLSFDGDPYPVNLDGNIVWVLDGYTTSARYPYAQDADTSQLDAGSGLDFTFNYVRNSVKAVVNAYDGSMAFYVVDQTDPIVKAWSSAFPDLFAPMSAMPAGLQDHLRYPEELFRLQTSAYSKYRLSPEVFFDRTGAWSVAQAPSAVPRTGGAGAAIDTTTDASKVLSTESGTTRFIPYYSMFRAPGDTTASFELFRPFVPFSTDDSRKELQAFMIASSDPTSYGKLRAYTLPTTIDGPATVASSIENDTLISQQLSLLDTGNSSVKYGDMQIVPVGGGLLYLRPLYVAADQTSQPNLRLMLASYGGKATFGNTLQEALAKLFPGFDTPIGDVVGGDTATTTPSTAPGTTTPGGVTPSTVPGGSTPSTTTAPSASDPKALLAQADELFKQADAALAQTPPDFATYAQKNAQARALIEQAMKALG